MPSPVSSRSRGKMASTLESLKKVYDRVEQTVAETVGSANKTELNPELLSRISMVDDIKSHVTSILAALEKHIPHDQRLISSFTASTHSAEQVAQAMKAFARSIENWPKNDRNEYIIQMFLCAEDVFKALSRSEKIYVENAAIHFLSPMKLFLNADMKKFEYERKNLMTARVDMDHARNRAVKTDNDQNVLEATRATAEFTKQKELIMKKQLDYDEAHRSPSSSVGSLPDPYHTQALHPAEDA